MVDSLSDTLRKHSAAMTEQGFPDKAAALAEAADLNDEFGTEKAKEMLRARLAEASGADRGDKAAGGKAELISFALGWMSYHS